MNFLTITESAADQLRAKMNQQNPRPEAAVLSVKNSGCSGLRYDLQFLSNLNDAPNGAEIINAHGVTVVIDPKASLYLIGTTMDYHKDAMHSGFEFTNPNEIARCGCGESFTVEKATEA